MTDEFRLPDWESKRERVEGPADRVVRFEKASRAIAEALVRNRTIVAGGPEVNDRGQIVYPVLDATGSLKMATQNELAKRNPNK